MMIDTLVDFLSTTESATVTVEPGRRGDPISRRLFGKFCEHLGRNIDGGMCAQILLNPTFGRWEFPAGDGHPDGGIEPTTDSDHVRAAVERYCDRWDFPDSAALHTAYFDGCAFGWTAIGDATTSPDVSPEGNRSQRVSVSGGESGGLRQATYLPLHRTREYELTCRLRATDAVSVDIEIASTDGDALWNISVDVDRTWRTVETSLTLPERVAGSDDRFDVRLHADGDVDVVVDRMTLYPEDHVNGSDPTVIEHLRRADLPLLRYPGGNFVSGYRWRDGVGPIDERATTVNPAWGRAEPNLFGTDEFVQFCETVGCEPMICVNAGDGTPEEAAKWVEYCNGDPETTEMGRLRAEHGHPEPHDITYWEIGNELFGRWQVNWTTPSGNADRYRQFRTAMVAVDSDIEIQAVGNEHGTENDWNDALLDRASDEVRCITDHVLTGGTVDAATDPHELFHAFMGYAEQLGETYRSLRNRMHRAGVDNPRLAITELQLFADFVDDPELGHYGTGLNEDSLPKPTTISEPLYDATILNECARIGEFVEMVTHSATVNHGGGLQKKRERTWADPAHYGHALLIPLAGTTPLGVTLECDTISTDHSFGDIEAFDGVPAFDAFAATDDDELHVVIVNRQSGDGTTDIRLDVSAFCEMGTASVTMLTADSMYAKNTYDRPERVTPTNDTAAVDGGELTVFVSEYSLLRVTLPLSVERRQ